MKARAVIHINGQDYDAVSGKALNHKIADVKAIKTVRSPAHSGAVHHPKPPQVHRTPAKSTTLSRAGVKKPKIFSDIRHTPIIGVETPATDHIPHHSAKLSPKVVHFAKIEPRMIDTSGTAEPPQAYPDSPPPIMHHLRHSKAESHIRKQLHAATAHQLSPHKKVKSHAPKRKKASVLASGIAAFVLIAGFVVYNSLPGLSVNLASKQAGFSAALPKFTPGGFKLNNHVTYGPGRVVLSFHSNTDDREYQIEQSPTNLNTEGLKKQLETDTNGNYQTVNAGGLSIFFSNSTARWTKDNVLYTLNGESGLSSSQIASIASSL